MVEKCSKQNHKQKHGFNAMVSLFSHVFNVFLMVFFHEIRTKQNDRMSQKRKANMDSKNRNPKLIFNYSKTSAFPYSYIEAKILEADFKKAVLEKHLLEYETLI